MPAAHSPYRQSCWHRPQWCGSVAVSTQLPPHSASPASQLDPPPPVPPAPPAPPIDDDVLAELVALDVLVTLAEALDVDVVEDVALVVWAPLPPAPPVPFGAAFPASSPMILVAAHRKRDGGEGCEPRRDLSCRSHRHHLPVS